MFSSDMLIGILLLLIFLAGAGFAVYGLVVFIRKHARKGESPAEEDHEALPESAASPFSSGEEDEARASGSAPPRTKAGRALQQYGAHLKGEFIMDKLFVRCLIIAGITLGLLVPLVFVSEMVDERSNMRRKAINDIASLWGGTQAVSGPVLVIPYQREYELRETVTDAYDRKKTVTRKALEQEYRLILPLDLDFEASLSPQVRRRGIYEYVVYTSGIGVKGTFRLPTVESFGEDAARIEWEKAYLSIGIADLKAIAGVEPLLWNNSPALAYAPGTNVKNLLGPGFHAPLALDGEDSAGQVRPFSLSLNLKGSGGLLFTPVGENTRIRISGQWPHPSFSGNVLPASRRISDTEFSAEWRIPHLSRTYPQSGILGRDDFNGSAILSFVAGVNLYEPVSLYSQVDRSVKYGILFIGLTFIALLSFELVTRARLHLMQYGLVGIAMTLFYLVLLSLAEHAPFILAFAAASLISIAMNGLYITAAMRSRKKGLIITGLLAALYLLLYALLQMEEYALLLGTFMVLIVVGVLMFLTRNLPSGMRKETGTAA